MAELEIEQLAFLSEDTDKRHGLNAMPKKL